jgi:hypothetical protein
MGMLRFLAENHNDSLGGKLNESWMINKAPIGVIMVCRIDALFMERAAVSANASRTNSSGAGSLAC